MGGLVITDRKIELPGIIHIAGSMLVLGSYHTASIRFQNRFEHGITKPILTLVVFGRLKGRVTQDEPASNNVLPICLGNSSIPVQTHPSNQLWARSGLIEPKRQDSS